MSFIQLLIGRPRLLGLGVRDEALVPDYWYSLYAGLADQVVWMEVSANGQIFELASREQAALLLAHFVHQSQNPHHEFSILFCNSFNSSLATKLHL